MRSFAEIESEIRRYENIIMELQATKTPNIIIYIIEIKLSALRWVLGIEPKL